eukprot:5711-Heterococcus_DN1.PRE.2
MIRVTVIIPSKTCTIQLISTYTCIDKDRQTERANHDVELMFTSEISGFTAAHTVHGTAAAAAET